MNSSLDSYSEKRRLQYYLLLLQLDEGVEDDEIELVEARSASPATTLLLRSSSGYTVTSNYFYRLWSPFQPTVIPTQSQTDSRLLLYLMLEELVLERFLAGRVAEAVEEHLNYSFIVNF